MKFCVRYFYLFHFILTAERYSLTTGQADPEPAVSVRVVGGINAREGVVLVTYDAQEGKLCDAGFDVQDAAVVCRMMGFTGEARVVTDEQTLFGPEATNLTNFILSDLDCDGSEPTIADCKKGFWFNTQCANKSDEVGVTCLGDRFMILSTTTTPVSTTTLPPRICQPGELPSEDVRLVGGKNVAEGRVEVRTPNGTWGSVCDDSWGRADAQVVCRMLCYNPVYSQARIGYDMFGNASSDFYLDEVQCTGQEDSIFNCTASVDAHDCDIHEPASVSCIRDAPLSSSSPRPILECSSENIVAKFDRRREPDLKEEYVTLQGGITADCRLSKSTDINYITLSIPFAGCNTHKEKTNSTHITYTNTIRHEVPSASTIISRSTIYNIEVSCIMPRDTSPELNFEPEVPSAVPVDGTGDFRVVMNLYADSDFTRIVQSFPAKVMIGDWVFVGVTLTTSDPNLKLVVPECWATPTEDPNQQPQYYFIQKKCKVDSTVFFYSMNETMFAFRFQSFKFLDTDQTYIYVHCQSYICDLSEKTPECDRTCNGATRRKRSALTSGHRRVRSTDRHTYETDRGPVLVLDKTQVAEHQSLAYPEHTPGSIGCRIRPTNLVVLCLLLMCAQTLDV